MAATPPNSPPAVVAGDPTPPVVKNDLIGSRLRLGILDRRDDRAVRRVIATAIPDDDNRGLGMAIDAAIDAFGYYHHHDKGDPEANPPTYGTTSYIDLPLAYVDATKFGKNKAYLAMSYERPRNSFPTSGFTTITRYESAYESVDVYREPTSFFLGMPNGQMRALTLDEPTRVGLPTAKDPRHEPTPWPYRRPVVKMIVSTYIATNPISAVGAKMAKINAESFAIGGFTFASWRLRFDGMRADWVIRQDRLGLPWWVMDYLFTAVEWGWWAQTLFYNDALREWDTRMQLQYDVWPDDNFPNHSGP